MLLPHLKITPDRLFDTYTFDQKAKIVKGFLFDKKTRKCFNNKLDIKLFVHLI